MTEYTNDDGAFPNVNCGQVAVANIRTALGLSPGRDAAPDLVRQLEAKYPPHWFGTSLSMMLHMLASEGLAYKMDFLRIDPIPDAVILYLLAIPLELPLVKVETDLGGHWTTLVSQDAGGIVLSNWGLEPWDHFNKMCRGLVPTIEGMAGKCLIVRAARYSISASGLSRGRSIVSSWPQSSQIKRSASSWVMAWPQ